MLSQTHWLILKSASEIGRVNEPELYMQLYCTEVGLLITYCILSSIVPLFYIENDAEIFPAHYTWKVTEKGFKMAFMMNKDAMINSCKIILEKKKIPKIIVKFRCTL